MKLVNKNTTNIKVFGEIVPCNEYGCIAVKTDQGVTWYYRSLAELNEEWEDYEEPKEYYCIDWTESDGIYKTRYEDVRDDFNKEIGNYFNTREEAEKAVEKLKAWKRLKDKGIVIRKLRHNENGGDMYWSCPSKTGINDKQIWLDLDLLFGGEE